jgi:hypothetical protein
LIYLRHFGQVISHVFLVYFEKIKYPLGTFSCDTYVYVQIFTDLLSIII